MFFPNHYDIRILTKGNDYLQGGLNRLAAYLDVLRKGTTHQAGSDSILTIDVFFKLIENEYIDTDYLTEDKNIIYGIDLGSDDNETINYTKIGNFTGYNCGENYQFNNLNYCQSMNFKPLAVFSN